MRKYVILAGSATAIAVAGCSSAGRTHQSSNALWTNTAPGNVAQMPSGFRNIASKCVKVGSEWFAVFTTSDGGNNNNLPAGVAAIPDPSCQYGLGTGR